MDDMSSVLNASWPDSVWHPLIDKDTFSLLMFINLGVVNTFISIVGLCTNVVVIVTFTKLGFKDTINISLTTLAVTDLASLVCLLWMSICFIPSFYDRFSVIIDLTNIDFIIGGIQRAYLTLISGCVTSIIACERCLCVLRPLQVRILLTKRKILIIIFSLLVTIAIPFIPLYFIFSVVWIFDPSTNLTLLSLSHKSHLQGVQSLCFSVHVALNVCTYLVVTSCTVVIVWKLTSQSAWRAGTTKGGRNDKSAESFAEPSVAGSQGGDQNVNKTTADDSSRKSGSGSNRDRRATMTVTLIAAMYIVCFFPGTALILTMALVPEFNSGRRYNNLYNVMWSVAYAFEGVCSTANIVVYVKTSTRFKEAFFSLLGINTDVKKM